MQVTYRQIRSHRYTCEGRMFFVSVSISPSHLNLSKEKKSTSPDQSVRGENFDYHFCNMTYQPQLGEFYK